MKETEKQTRQAVVLAASVKASRLNTGVHDIHSHEQYAVVLSITFSDVSEVSTCSTVYSEFTKLSLSFYMGVCVSK